MAFRRAAPVAALLAVVAGTPAVGAPVDASAGYAWARPAMGALAAAGGLGASEDPARVATRRDLARALAALGNPAAAAQPATFVDVASDDPDAPAIAAAVAAGRMGPRTGRFRPDDPVTGRVAAVAVLHALDLGAEMRGLGRLSTTDGARLRVPPGFAAAVLTRELGLRHNHPARFETLERADAEAMALGDLAGMVEAARRVDTWRLAAMSRYREITLPTMTPARRAVVEAALAQVGSPYVWGGDWPTPRSPWGPQARGGFDCSGLVWMAFKGARGPAAMGAGADLRGRTADAMAWEAPTRRIPVAEVSAGDLVFFGRQGGRTGPGGVEHVAIGLGGGWIVHSSGSRAGVSVSRVDAYWPSGLAGARRPAAFGAPTPAPAPPPAATPAPTPSSPAPTPPTPGPVTPTPLPGPVTGPAPTRPGGR